MGGKAVEKVIAGRRRVCKRGGPKRGAPKEEGPQEGHSHVEGCLVA